MGKEKQGLPRSPRIKMAFDREAFDCFFQRFAGSHTNGGLETGEIFYAASQIEVGNVTAWTRKFDARGASLRLMSQAAVGDGPDQWQ